MRAWVYRLRCNGQRLAGAEVLERGPAAGELVFRRRLERTRIMFAQLMAPDGAYVIPCLDRAQLLRIEADGMLMSGYEVIPRRRGAKSRADWMRQSWWIELGPPGELALARERLRTPLAAVDGGQISPR